MERLYPDIIEVLGRQHDRKSFSCGNPALDQYLKTLARQHGLNRVSRTYVACKDQTIMGYYSLAMSAIRKENLPGKYLGRYPDYPLPVARLARLAVDQRFQRQGLGQLLLSDALSRCLKVSDVLGMIGVIVDAKDNKARQWYERFEFEQFVDAPLTLWIPVTALEYLQEML